MSRFPAFSQLVLLGLLIAGLGACASHPFDPDRAYLTTEERRDLFYGCVLGKYILYTSKAAARSAKMQNAAIQGCKAEAVYYARHLISATHIPPQDHLVHIQQTILPQLEQRARAMLTEFDQETDAHPSSDPTGGRSS